MAVSVGLSLVGCFYPKAGPPPGPLTASTVERAQGRWPDATLGSLEAGRSLFLGNCNRCHGYPIPSAYSEERWRKIVPWMGGKAGLSDAEQENVLRFLLARRDDPNR